MFGGIGGTVEHRSAMLASRGIAALALCYISKQHYGGINTELEFYLSAVDYLASHPAVTPGGVGLIAVSLGATLVLYMAAYSSKVRAVIAINGLWFNSIVQGLSLGGRELPFPTAEELAHPLYGQYGAMDQNEDGTCIWRWKVDDTLETMYKQYMPPLQKSRAHFLFLHGELDVPVPPVAGFVVKQYLQEYGVNDSCDVVVYKGAGHLIEPPYAPFCYSSFSPVMGRVLVWGGEAEAHNKAQEDAWTRTLEFFNSHLSREQCVQHTAKL